MKKVDKLVLKAFLGPFFLTLFVVVFILLMVNLLKYFDDLVGKDLGWQVFAEFMGYFAVYMTPMSIPLAVLLSSLMAYGNLGEHSELTAIKGAGISLSRSMRSVFFFVVIITAVTFYSNNFIAPMTALKAYSLLYDIKQKKPALDLKQGTFYSGMKDFSIKVNEKYPDGKTLKDLIIYDHSDARGNTEVIVADSGKMYTVHNDRYLKMELFDGYYFMEGSSANPNRKTVSRDKVSPYSRTRFSKSEMMFDLSEFDLQRTKEELFSKDRLVRGLNQLYKDMDSISYELLENRYETMVQTNGYYNYHLKGYEIDYPDEFQLIIKNRDSIEAIKSRINYDISKGDTVSRGIKKGVLNALILPDKPPLTSEDAPKFKPKDDLVVVQAYDTTTIDSLEAVFMEAKKSKTYIVTALNRARNYKSRLGGQVYQINYDRHHYLIYGSELQRRTARAVSCLMMFLIGAPLGAIIKRGGLGVPVLISVTFFILFYVLEINGEKWIREETLTITQGVWLPNVVLFPIGLFFLNQARQDARLFDLDAYRITLSNFWKKLRHRKR